MRKIGFFFITALFFFSDSVIEARIITSLQQLNNAPQNSVCEITSTIDLKGGTAVLKPNIVLKFNKGSIKNGTVIGSNTYVENGKDYFTDVTIKGTWNAPVISSAMFSNLTKSNSINNVIALTNPNVYNIVSIERGEYWVDTELENPSISICDNTNIILDGSIKLKPNSKTAYSIVSIKGNNITLSGHGEIIGDRDKHQGLTGEWGMGLSVYGGRNVVINGLKISNCWGDGIYVYGDSKNVLISDCKISDCRRQGVSITAANMVCIQRCEIRGIGGTSPGLGIDIEPNANNSVDNVFISDVVVKDCEGGMSVSNRAKGSLVGGITIRNSSFWGTKKNYCVLVAGSTRTIIENCMIESGNSTALWLSEIDSVCLYKNSFKSTSPNAVKKYKCKDIQESNNVITKYTID